MKNETMNEKKTEMILEDSRAGLESEQNGADSAASELEKKIRRKKVQAAVMIVVAVLIAAAVLFAVFFPRGSGSGKGGSATLTISCASLAEDLSQLNDKTLEKYIPKDGLILPETSYEITPEETTVFDLLTRACREQDIQIEYNSTPVYGGSYIEGIGYLYEFSAGKYSGWKYTVNGKVPSYAADKVKLKDGDEVVWYYSVDYRTEGF